MEETKEMTALLAGRDQLCAVRLLQEPAGASSVPNSRIMLAGENRARESSSLQGVFGIVLRQAGLKACHLPYCDNPMRQGRRAEGAGQWVSQVPTHHTPTFKYSSRTGKQVKLLKKKKKKPKLNWMNNLDKEF